MPAMSSSLYYRRSMYGLLGSLFFAYSFFLQGTEDHIRSHLTLTRILSEQHTVVADAYVNETIDLAKYQSHYYVSKSPGFAYSAAPLWKFLSFWTSDLRKKRLIATVLLNGLPGVLAVFLFFRALRRFSVPYDRAYLYSIALGLGTPLFSYSTLFCQTSLTIVCLLLAFEKSTLPTPREQDFFHSGLFLGFSTTLDIPNAVLFIPFALHLWLTQRNLRRLGFFSLGFFMSVSLYGFYNFLCFSNPFMLGYFTHAVAQFQTATTSIFSRVFIPRPQAVWGLTLSAQEGLFYFSPFLLFSLWGFRQLCKSSQKYSALLLLGAVGVMFLFIASFTNWRAGLLAGPRYLINIIPFFALGLAGVNFKEGNRSGQWMKALFLVSMAGSILIWFTITAVGPYSPEHLAFPLKERFLHDLLAGNLTPNIVLALSPEASQLSLIPVIVIPAIGIALGWSNIKKYQEGRGE